MQADLRRPEGIYLIIVCNISKFITCTIPCLIQMDEVKKNAGKRLNEMLRH